MLTANVLCLKKRKKRTYSLSGGCSSKGYNVVGREKNERSRGHVTMMQITEDTPPDMLSGAMDLTVHLPNGKMTKMAVERSTPMMDLLVQIATANQLQLSHHTLEVLGMAPSLGHSDRVLPFKPNTPIGTLDTQHIRVLPKGKSLPAPKYIAPGHQPFESTFRLKVHLPRNQLYVTRVSRNVLLEDIMKKVCEEKNLDPVKYDFKHPGNLDEVLDPKLTLSDYQITEIYVVAKGTTNLTQAFSAADIMVLRKEEERKQMHSKTGGGVFNLIFKRGKSSMGSGSVSSENRSISPIHSDDSRSVTPPAPIVASPPQERPKPPQRKRRPAPKPPSIQVQSDEKTSSVVSTTSQNSSENGLTICHSRNSSDSSGYHEASILSDHCNNTSLPRTRPKSAFVGDLQPLQGGSNLSKMAAQSRSTTSLIIGRKKKAAPPPPQPPQPAPVEPPPSPLVASQTESTPPVEEFSEVLDSTPKTNPLPKPRTRKVPKAPPRHKEDLNEDFMLKIQKKIDEKDELNRLIVDEVVKETLDGNKLEFHLDRSSNYFATSHDYSMEEILTSLEAVKPFIMNTDSPRMPSLTNSTKSDESSQPPSIVGVIPKNNVENSKSLEEQSNTDNFFVEENNNYYEESRTMTRDLSVTSLKSNIDPVVGMRKWDNFEDLDNISVNSGIRNRWVAGDASDAESATSTPLESINLENTPVRLLHEEKSLESTDSGIAQDTHSDREKDIEEEFGFDTPPPPIIDEPVVPDELIPPPPPQTEPPEEVELSTDKELVDIDWQYQLPSPPKAFRDSSPNVLPSETDFKDSVVTSPELFEKLQSLEDSEVETVKSEGTSVASEEPLNTLSLEHLEKRKSLVYNRELATSLKMTDSVESSAKTFVSSFREKAPSPPKPVRTSSLHHTLPNFKISTYDVPKQNIKVFEDDTIRSNNVSNLKRNTFGYSMENISFTKRNSLIDDVVFKAKLESTVNRSGSFSTENRPVKPVSRSKSTLTINKYQGRQDDMGNISRSNSLYDVSGLQSLEVMKLIQNKLHTPTASVENVNSIPQPQKVESSPLKVDCAPPQPKPASPQPPKKYQYRGPPSINMSTWSERPKVPVAVKEDEDYKFNNVRSNGTTVTVNGSEPMQQSGNVIIKIGGTHRFVGPTGYKKPFFTLKENEERPARPHSIALPSDFDISRIPVVRSVEFKKPFKDLHQNTSITHLNQANDFYRSREVTRVNSFKPVESVPTVRGFNSSDINKRLSWNPSYGKPSNFGTNQHVPFGQSTLRRTDSSKRLCDDTKSLPPLINNNVAPAPPPPPAVVLRKVAPPKSNQSSPVDARDTLLESIRNFGGKKGLRSAKA